MPQYNFICTKCFRPIEERTLTMKEIEKPQFCEHCGYQLQRDFKTDLFNPGNKEYGKTKFSDALAISPEQVTEHKKLFPDIPIDSQCRPGFDNYKQHENYLQKTGFEKARQKIKRKGKRIA